MKTTHTVVTICLILLAGLFVGCTTVEVQVSNPTDKAFSVGLSGGGRGQENLGLLGAEGNITTSKKYKNSNLPANVTLTVGKQKVSFTVSEDGPRAFRYQINFQGKLVKLVHEEEHERIVDTKTPQGPPEEVVTE